MLFFNMLIQKTIQVRYVEELPGRFRGERLADLSIVLRVTKPYTDRNRESQFLLLGCLAAYHLIRRHTQRHLGPGRLDFIVQRKCFREFHYFFIEKRDADLNRVRHSHFISLHKYIMLDRVSVLFLHAAGSQLRDTVYYSFHRAAHLLESVPIKLDFILTIRFDLRFHKQTFYLI